MNSLLEIPDCVGYLSCIAFTATKMSQPLSSGDESWQDPLSKSLGLDDIDFSQNSTDLNSVSPEMPQIPDLGSILHEHRNSSQQEIHFNEWERNPISVQSPKSLKKISFDEGYKLEQVSTDRETYQSLQPQNQGVDDVLQLSVNSTPANINYEEQTERLSMNDEEHEGDIDNSYTNIYNDNHTALNQENLYFHKSHNLIEHPGKIGQTMNSSQIVYGSVNGGVPDNSLFNASDSHLPPRVVYTYNSAEQTHSGLENSDDINIDGSEDYSNYLPKDSNYFLNDVLMNRTGINDHIFEHHAEENGRYKDNLNIDEKHDVLTDDVHYSYHNNYDHCPDILNSDITIHHKHYLVKPPSPNPSSDDDGKSHYQYEDEHHDSNSSYENTNYNNYGNDDMNCDDNDDGNSDD